VRLLCHYSWIAFFSLVCVVAGSAQQGPAPNSDPTYQQLRNLTLGSESVTVNNVTLKRDAATFRLRSGTLCFVSPVQGKVTGAVFIGEGNLTLDVPITIENDSLKLFTKQDEFVETYQRLVLRFTDSTYEELKKAGTPGGSCDAGPLRDSQHAMRHADTLKYNLDARILEDVLSPNPGKLFVAFVDGKRYSGKELFIADPQGGPALPIPVAPEEVEFVTYDQNKLGVWAAFHFADEYKTGAATGTQKNAPIHISHQELDTSIEKNAHLAATAKTTFVATVDGLRAVPFNLFHTLRVSSVTGENSQPLSFIQEDKNDDSDFWVVLPQPLARGQQYTITSTYEGKEAVVNEGGGNFFPVARENWYPNNASGGLGEYTSYDMTFRIPKGMKMAATGAFITEKNEGSQNVSEWKSTVPQTVAGFNFGRFKVEQVKLDKPDYLIQAFANEEQPDEVKNLLNASEGKLPGQFESGYHFGALGNMSTMALVKKALGEAELSTKLYTDYFGALPFKQLEVTQQTSCNYGQSWPGLVYLPMCYFYDTTIRNQLGLQQFGIGGYWKVVTPHEVAHQWWGHDIGFNSYRDQWMSEGFADMSASLYTQLIEKNPKKFIEFWNDERTMLLEKNKEGFRAIDAGPVTQGYRMSNSRTGFDVTRRLIYPKGAYILHMLRMMMIDNQTGDQDFKNMMHDFVQTYSGKAASTEDFKAMVEKHMTPDMQRIGGGKMDWFFNEYVYGTALPSYKVDSNFEKNSSGDMVLSMKLTQSGVNDAFRMLVPVYLEMADGRLVNLGRVTVIGNATENVKVPFPGLKQAPRRVMVNYYDDVLAAN
jgi:hypothetical protein